jgi:hypothetical protein
MKMHQPYSRFARAVALLSATALVLPDFAVAQPGNVSASDEIHADSQTPQIIAVPVPLPLPGQLKPLSRRGEGAAPARPGVPLILGIEWERQMKQPVSNPTAPGS